MKCPLLILVLAQLTSCAPLNTILTEANKEKIDKFIAIYGVTNETINTVFEEEARKINITASSHFDACYDYFVNVDGWQQKFFALSEKASKSLKNERFNSTDELLASLKRIDPDNHQALGKYADYTRNVLKDVSEEAREYVEWIGQNSLEIIVKQSHSNAENNKENILPIIELLEKILARYDSLSDQAKTDIERKFCYSTFSRFSPGQSYRDMVQMAKGHQ